MNTIKKYISKNTQRMALMLNSYIPFTMLSERFLKYIQEMELPIHSYYVFYIFEMSLIIKMMLCNSYYISILFSLLLSLLHSSFGRMEMAPLVSILNISLSLSHYRSLFM